MNLKQNVILLFILVVFQIDTAEGRKTLMMKALNDMLTPKAKELFQSGNIIHLANIQLDDFSFLELTYLANILYLEKEFDDNFNLNALLLIVDFKRITIYQQLGDNLEQVESKNGCRYNMFHQMHKHVINVVLRDKALKKAKMSMRDLKCLEERLTNDQSIWNPQTSMQPFENVFYNQNRQNRNFIRKRSVQSRANKMTPVMKELENRLSPEAQNYFQPDNLGTLKNMNFDEFTFNELTYLANMLYIEKENDPTVNNILYKVDLERILVFRPFSASLIEIEKVDGCKYNMFYQMDINLILDVIEKIRSPTDRVSKLTNNDLKCLHERALLESVTVSGTSLAEVVQNFIEKRSKETTLTTETVNDIQKSTTEIMEFDVHKQTENETISTNLTKHNLSPVWKFFKISKIKI